MFQLLKDCIHAFKPSRWGSQQCLGGNNGNAHCITFTLGSIIHSIPRHDLWPIYSPVIAKDEPYQQSIDHLLRIIKRIEVIRLNDDHKACNPIPAFLAKANDIVSKVENPVIEVHRFYISKQRERIGHECDCRGRLIC